MIVLWETNVGSHAWKMNHPGSDLDLFRCYVASSRDILSGAVAPGGTHFNHGEEVDVQSHEIGAWVEQLLKMNLNYLIGLFSPIVLKERPNWPGPTYLEELREIVRANLSRQAYFSIHGMIVKNKRKYLDGQADPPQKKINQGCRAAVMGIRLLSRGEIAFKPFTNGTVTILEGLLLCLDQAYAESALPVAFPVEGVKAVRDWLFRIRLAELQGTL